MTKPSRVLFKGDIGIAFKKRLGENTALYMSKLTYINLVPIKGNIRRHHPDFFLSCGFGILFCILTENGMSPLATKSWPFSTPF